MAMPTTTNYGFPKPPYGYPAGQPSALEFAGDMDAADAALSAAIAGVVATAVNAAIAAALAAGTVTPGYFSRLKVAPNASTPTVKLDVTIGSVVLTDGTNYTTLTSFSGSTLDLSNAGSIGLINGIKSAVLHASTQYSLYVIYNPTTVVSGLWLDTNATTPTPPTGYTRWRKILSLVTDGSGHFYSFVQRNAKVTYNTYNNIVLNGGNAGTYTAVSLAAFVPTDVINVGLFDYATGSSVPVAYISFDNANDFYLHPAPSAGTYYYTDETVPITVSQTIYYKIVGGGSPLYYIYVTGYEMDI